MLVLDVNVCIHAVNAQGAQHAAAKAYLEDALSGDQPVAFAWVVLLGFLRITTNSRIMPNPLTPEQGMNVIDSWLESPVAEILEPGREHWRILKELIEESGTAGNLTTDSHLAALAIENGAKLVSFDNDFKRFKHLKVINPHNT